MNFPKLAYKRRTARRLAVLSVMALLTAAAFGASLVFAQEAQEGRAFLVWRIQSSGGAQVTDEGRNILQGLVGQPAVGTMSSDDDDEDNEQFELTLGFHTGVMAGPEPFAELVQNLALTPLPTQAAESTETPTPGPTEAPTETSTEVPSSPTATAESQTPEATATAEPQPSTATATPVQPSPTAVSVPTRTPAPVPPTATATLAPPADTPSPTPPPTATSEPAPTRTPIYIVVTSPPAEQPPTPTATPVPASGGICSVPGNGPRPLDVGLLLMLAAPIALWRFGIRP